MYGVETLLGLLIVIWDLFSIKKKIDLGTTSLLCLYLIKIQYGRYCGNRETKSSTDSDYSIWTTQNWSTSDAEHGRPISIDQPMTGSNKQPSLNSEWERQEYT